MKKIVFLFLLIWTANSQSTDVKKLEISSQLSKNFHYLIEQLEHENKVHFVISELKEINEKISYIHNIDEFNLLINLEFKKLILNSKFDKSIFKGEVSPKDITLAQKKLINIRQKVSKLTHHILNMAVNDFVPYLSKRKLKLYNENKNNKLLNYKERTSIQKIYKYSSPWVVSLLNKTPSQINQQVTQLTIQFFKNLSDQLEILKQHTSQKASKNMVNLIRGLESIKKDIENSPPQVEEFPKHESNPLELLKDIPSKSRDDSLKELFKDLPPAQ